jgi:hypothetical protein
MQWPKVPKVTEEWRISVLFVSITLRMPMSPMTGDEIEVTRRRIAAMKMNDTPIQWKPRNMIIIAWSTNYLFVYCAYY